MATIDSEEIIAAIIDGNGIYPGDDPANPVIRIVRYVNQWDGTAYGVVYKNEPLRMRYRYENAGPACRDPEVIWTLDDAG